MTKHNKQINLGNKLEDYWSPDGHQKSAKNFYSLIVPIFAFSFFSTIYTTWYISVNIKGLAATSFGQYSYYTHIIQALILSLLPAIALVTGYKYLIKQASDLIYNIYRLSDTEKIGPLIQRRLIEYPPPPFNRILKYPFVILQEPSLDENHWTRWFGGPALIAVYDGISVCFENYNRSSRIVGPGISFLKEHERIKEIVDLRPQIKTDDVTAWTKDGILVKLTIKAEFQIYTSPNAIRNSSKFRYPFDPDSVRKAIDFAFIKTAKIPQAQSWLDSTWEFTAGLLNTFINGYSIDEIFLGTNTKTFATSKIHQNYTQENIEQIFSRNISKKIVNKIQIPLHKAGIKVLDLQIINVDLPEKIKDIRAQYWRSMKQKEVAFRNIREEAYQIRADGQKRAETQRHLLETMIQKLENIDSDIMTESLLLSIADILDNNDPTGNPSAMKEILDTLERIRKLLRERF